MGNTPKEEKLKEKSVEDDNYKAENAGQDTLDWLDKNQLAGRDESKAKQKRVHRRARRY